MSDIEKAVVEVCKTDGLTAHAAVVKKYTLASSTLHGNIKKIVLLIQQL